MSLEAVTARDSNAARTIAKRSARSFGAGKSTTARGQGDSNPATNAAVAPAACHRTDGSALV